MFTRPSNRFAIPTGAKVLGGDKRWCTHRPGSVTSKDTTEPASQTSEGRALKTAFAGRATTASQKSSTTLSLTIWTPAGDLMTTTPDNELACETPVTVERGGGLVLLSRYVAAKSNEQTARTLLRAL